MAWKKRLTWKDVLNSFLIRLVSTGQLPLVLFILLLGFLIYRTPTSQVGDVWRILQMMLDRHTGLGYGLAGGTFGGWMAHAKYQRRKFSKEFDRIGDERNKAQQKHFSQKLKSSDK